MFNSRTKKFLLLISLLFTLPFLITASENEPELIKEVDRGEFSEIYYLTSGDDYLYFASHDGDENSQLWKSDGTEEGTVMVKDINEDRSTFDGISYTTMMSNNILYFTANDGINGEELWKSDGTEAGTVMVKDIYPGNSSRPKHLIEFNNTLYFSANDGVNGVEFWKSDGTEAGTVMVKDINSGAGHSSPSNMEIVGDMLFFEADDGKLWKSDGTEAGTVMVKDIARDANISSATEVNGQLFFAANDGINGKELWKSDGTEAGTVMVKDIYPGNSSSPAMLTSFNNLLFFKADDGVHGKELWKSDGTEAGTVMVKNINPDNGSDPTGYGNFHALDDHIYFSASGNDQSWSNKELWKSDGTEEGTVLVKNINENESSFGSMPSYFNVFDNHLFFRADDDIHGKELWKSDGTEEGTVMVANINECGDSSPKELTIFNNSLLFIANDRCETSFTNQLWALASSGGSSEPEIINEQIGSDDSSSNNNGEILPETGSSLISNNLRLINAVFLINF